MNAQLLKAKISCSEFFRRELKMITHPQASGWTNGGLCPFHDDHRAGNFRVNLQTGAFKCFACGKQGQDIIRFTELRYQLSFPEALRRLADGNY